jgi:hypothetical protein
MESQKSRRPLDEVTCCELSRQINGSDSMRGRCTHSILGRFGKSRGSALANTS